VDETVKKPSNSIEELVPAAARWPMEDYDNIATL